MIATPVAAQAAEGGGFDEEVIVVAPTPTGTRGIPLGKLPFSVSAADSDALERAQSTDLTDFLGNNLGSVSINSAQGNPLQPDVQFRGFTASPLLGLPMGIAVYQNGARINEPLGDAVNWDLVPQSAIYDIVLVSGANPLYGLNTLGGALSIKMKNGFNFEGHEAEVLGGSWGRVQTTAESGGNNGRFGYYLNVGYFDEDGWRDLSESDALNVYGSVGYREGPASLDLNFQYGDSELRGNGASPAGLLAIDRSAVFTAPDITANEMVMVSLESAYDFSDDLGLAGSGFYRDNTTDAFNGDASEFSDCAINGQSFLLEGLEEDELEGLSFMGTDLGEVCEDDPFAGRVVNGTAVTDPDSLEDALNFIAGADEFDIDDLTDSLRGTGLLADSAINNRSRREQESFGGDLQLTDTSDLLGRGNYFVVGLGYFHGEARFDSTIELSNLDPVTRSTAGLGTGTFVSEGATSVATRTATVSVYFMDAIDVTDSVTLTVGGRWNQTDVKLRDQSGDRPELNGDHTFSRFNPSVGITWDVLASANVFAGYSESTRAPTPIELACNEGVFELARQFADDPDDVEFECRLPNAFLADPPLEAVTARSWEAGVRGARGPLEYRAGWFRTTSADDIIFQTTGRSTGLFANVDQTRRTGFETALAGGFGDLSAFLNYSYVRATFEDDFAALSPNHAFADDAGEIAVTAGDRIPGTPAHQLKFGGDYQLAAGLGLGLEVVYNSKQYLRGDESNQLDPIDGYAVVNLRARYAVNPHIEIFGRVTNLFGADYENFGLLGEDPTEVLPGLRDNRPRFLGAGSPRAGWVGIRVRL